MSDIELVVKIPEEIRLALINNIQLSLDQQSICDSYIKHAIINGTPLPKGHGDLVDTTYFEHYLRDTYIDSVSFKRAISAMKRLSTIIEADKEQTDGNVATNAGSN